MNNQEIASAFALLARLMELHDENPFKIRSYQNASININRMDEQLGAMNVEEIQAIPGVGKAISSKIKELLTEGKMKTLEKYKDLTPEGIIELVQIKGIGVKKIRAIWQNLGVESVGELLYACNEHRLIELRGFGAKTQDSIQRQLEYYLRNRSKFLFAQLEPFAEELKSKLKELYPESQISFTGEYRRYMPVLDKIEFLISGLVRPKELREVRDLEIIDVEEGKISVKYKQQVNVLLYSCPIMEYGTRLLKTTGPDIFIRSISNLPDNRDEKELFAELQRPWVEPEARDIEPGFGKYDNEIVTENDIKGVIHCHTNYSDGANTIKELADYAVELSYDYIGITDHSQIAVYADGMDEEDLVRQWDEIDKLNKSLNNFRVLKGIECDILSEGNLDYSNSILEKFDFIIASVHTVLMMDKARATDRIIKAIEHPKTNILGHPTGRILLGRKGYELNFDKIFDACKANNVAVELNANPYRLDIPWNFLPIARKKNVMISINPDAHSRRGIKDIKYGVLCARKGWLTSELVLNTKNVEAFLDFCSKH